MTLWNTGENGAASTKFFGVTALLGDLLPLLAEEKCKKLAPHKNSKGYENLTKKKVDFISAFFHELLGIDSK